MSKILIIEDDEAIASIERDYLEIDNFEVEIASNGIDGCLLYTSSGPRQYVFLFISQIHFFTSLQYIFQIIPAHIRCALSFLSPSA